MPAAMRTFFTVADARWCTVSLGSGRPSAPAKRSIVPCSTIPSPLENELPSAAAARADVPSITPSVLSIACAGPAALGNKGTRHARPQATALTSPLMTIIELSTRPNPM
eukprot:3786087-Prymnesium_polylepis.2